MPKSLVHTRVIALKDIHQRYIAAMERNLSFVDANDEYVVVVRVYKNGTKRWVLKTRLGTASLSINRKGDLATLSIPHHMRQVIPTFLTEGFLLVYIFGGIASDIPNIAHRLAIEDSGAMAAA